MTSMCGVFREAKAIQWETSLRVDIIVPHIYVL